MLRSSLCTAGVVVLSAVAPAQKLELRTYKRVEGPVKDAGVLHVATGTWTRRNGGASLGSGGNRTIYDCTTNSGYYVGIDPGQVWFASGRIPSTTSPTIHWNPIAAPVGSAPGSARGCADSYTVDGYQIGYCTDAPAASTQITINFYEQWTTTGPVCVNPVNTAPQATHIYTHLPGQPGGSQACWLVTFDLSAAASPNAPFAMMADGDGSYLDNTSDAFGWSFTFPSVHFTTAATGMLLNGAIADGTGPSHPNTGWREFPPQTTIEAAGYDGTRFDVAPLTGAPLGGSNLNYPANGADGINSLPGNEAGSDMLGADGYRIEGGVITPGCYFFGGPITAGPGTGGPYSNFRLELYASVNCDLPEPGTGYCFGDGIDPIVTVQTCPCANFGAPGRGCASSFNSAGARITASGVVATDGTSIVGSGVILHGDGMNLTAGQSCIFLAGDTDAPGGIAFGDGTRCASGGLIRLRTKRVTPNALPLGGTSDFPDATDPQPLSVRGATPVGSGLTGHYTVYYRNAAAGFCPAPPNGPGGTFNTGNGYKITW